MLIAYQWVDIANCNIKINSHISDYMSEWLFTDTIAVNMLKIKIIHKRYWS